MTMIPLQVKDGGTGDSGTPWSSAVVTVAPTSGSYTNASATMWYKLLGKTMYMTIAVNLVTIGTGTGYMLISIPYMSARDASLSSVASTGSIFDASNLTAMTAAIPSGSSVIKVSFYNNATSFASNEVFRISGVMEIV